MRIASNPANIAMVVLMARPAAQLPVIFHKPNVPVRNPTRLSPNADHEKPSVIRLLMPS